MKAELYILAWVVAIAVGILAYETGHLSIYLGALFGSMVFSVGKAIRRGSQNER